MVNPSAKRLQKTNEKTAEEKPRREIPSRQSLGSPRSVLLAGRPMAPPSAPLNTLLRWGIALGLLMGLGWGLLALFAQQEQKPMLAGEARLEMLMVGGAQKGDAGIASKSAVASDNPIAQSNTSAKQRSQVRPKPQPDSLPEPQPELDAEQDAQPQPALDAETPPQENREIADSPQAKRETTHTQRETARQAGQQEAARNARDGEADDPLVSAELLDPGFRLLRVKALVYPPAALNLRRAGKVRLEIEVDAQGRATRVVVLGETGDWGFGGAASKAYSQAHFTPPTRQGKPVRVRWRKTLVFRP